MPAPILIRNPEIWKRNLLDPGAEEDGQASWSPYGCVFNNPVRNTNPD